MADSCRGKRCSGHGAGDATHIVQPADAIELWVGPDGALEEDVGALLDVLRVEEAAQAGRHNRSVCAERIAGHKVILLADPPPPPRPPEGSRSDSQNEPFQALPQVVYVLFFTP